MNYYKEGRAYTETEIDGVYSYEKIPNITVIDGVEYIVLGNAPEPFVYGAKVVVTTYSVTNGYQKYYDPITGEYKSDNLFKGKAWLEDETPTHIDTLTDRQAATAVVTLPKG